MSWAEGLLPLLRDERTMDMWAADLEAANRVETLLSGISLEMTA